MGKCIGFVLGRETELSKAEIFTVLDRKGVDAEQIFGSREILILKLKSYPELSIDQLGGTIKLFEILTEKIEKADLKQFIKDNFVLGKTEQRVNFGISGYGRMEKDFIYKVGKTLKNEMVNGGLKARFVTGKFKDLSSVIVTENKLLERGFEAILVEERGKFFVGKTIAVQNYKAYSKRDYGRLARDEKSGMLPPKLAQIMINLADVQKDGIIYDPFCGSGTILQEAILLGYQKVVGSDISPKAIEDTKTNLNWLFEKFPKEIAIDVFESDILNPSKTIPADAIVSEGYLGEPIRRNVAKANADATILTDFYLRSLTNMARMLSANGRIVLAIPFFIIGKERVFLAVKDKVSLTGLKINNSYTYSRPDSFVGRQILCLQKG
jgi:tRNA G10  N-methylase Trm11